jgi:hypothetical protein
VASINDGIWTTVDNINEQRKKGNRNKSSLHLIRQQIAAAFGKGWKELTFFSHKIFCIEPISMNFGI